jgi:hypothetical protein
MVGGGEGRGGCLPSLVTNMSPLSSPVAFNSQFVASVGSSCNPGLLVVSSGPQQLIHHLNWIQSWSWPPRHILQSLIVNSGLWQPICGGEAREGVVGGGKGQGRGVVGGGEGQERDVVDVVSGREGREGVVVVEKAERAWWAVEKAGEGAYLLWLLMCCLCQPLMAVLPLYHIHQCSIVDLLPMSYSAGILEFSVIYSSHLSSSAVVLGSLLRLVASEPLRHCALWYSTWSSPYTSPCTCQGFQYPSGRSLGLPSHSTWW